MQFQYNLLDYCIGAKQNGKDVGCAAPCFSRSRDILLVRVCLYALARLVLGFVDPNEGDCLSSFNTNENKEIARSNHETSSYWPYWSEPPKDEDVPGYTEQTKCPTDIEKQTTLKLLV